MFLLLCQVSRLQTDVSGGRGFIQESRQIAKSKNRQWSGHKQTVRDKGKIAKTRTQNMSQNQDVNTHKIRISKVRTNASQDSVKKEAVNIG